jgi:ABC-type microcin C transport system duplicated ATPase subunit YejF
VKAVKPDGVGDYGITARITTQGSIVLTAVFASLSGRARRQIMGDQMAMVFQEPMTSILNPVYHRSDY